MSLFNINNDENTTNDFTVVDVETATSKSTSICAIGLVFLSNNKIQDSKYYLLRPENNLYDPINIRIHNITPDMTENAPSFSELWSTIKNSFYNKSVIAHYAHFDLKCLHDICKENKIDPQIKNVYCTCIAAKHHFPQLPNHKLPTISKHLDIALNHHNALSDATATAKIFTNLPKMSQLKGLMDYSEAINRAQYNKIFFAK